MQVAIEKSFGPGHADVYELVHRHRGKDWSIEAGDVAERILALKPEARSLLDVGCGTGAHLETLRTRFLHVEGLELATAMLECARHRLPGVSVHQGDMRKFRLDRTFAAVTSLCCATGYLDTVADLQSAIACMSSHLEPGGVLVVEPWWLEDRYIDGYVGSDMISDGDRVVARVSHTTKRDGAAHMDVRCLIGDPNGLRSFRFTEAFTLFNQVDYYGAFDAAGCSADYVERWMTGRGLFVGVKRA